MDSMKSPAIGVATRHVDRFESESQTESLGNLHDRQSASKQASEAFRSGALTLPAAIVLHIDVWLGYKARGQHLLEVLIAQDDRLGIG